jgi:hypothetical protein
MIDPSITESGIGMAIMGALTFMMRNLNRDQRRSRRLWEQRIETDIEHIEKVIGGFRYELDRERKQRGDLTDKIIALMATLADNKDAMSNLSKAFAGYVATSDKRLLSLESSHSEVIELGKTLRLIRTKKPSNP